MTKIYPIFNILALSVIIYCGVDIFYKVGSSQIRQISTKEIAMQQIPDVELHKTSQISDFKVIMERNIFGSLVEGGRGVKEEEIESLEPTSLKVALLGTVTGSKQNAYAVIEEIDKRKQGLYRVGDSVQNAIVKMILRGKVILTVGDKDEILTMEESASSKPESPGTFPMPFRKIPSITVSRADLQSSLENMNELLTQVRVRPHFKDGEADGLLIDRIKGGSIFSKLGLRNGDVVQGVNGKAIEGPDDIFALYDSLKSGSEVSIQMTRRNRPKTLNYRFK